MRPRLRVKHAVAAGVVWAEWSCKGGRLPGGQEVLDSGRRYVRCYPCGFAVRLVCDVDLSTLEYCVRWAATIGTWRRAPSLEEAKERALDAAELLLADTLENA